MRVASRRVLPLLCVVVVATAFLSPAEPDGLHVSRQAWQTANATWGLSVGSQRERGLCVPSGAYSWGYNRKKRLWVAIDSFAVDGPQGPRIDSADVNSLWWNATICGDSNPALHTHIQEGDSLPSTCDKQGFERRPRVPFWLVQWEVGRITLLAVRPGADRPLAADTTDYCT